MAVMALLAGMLLTRLHQYQRQAELAKVQQVVGVLRSALRMEVASLHAHDSMRELIALAEQNPMRWLIRAPNNYLGEYCSPDISQLKSGSWYYDPGKQTLVYLMQNRKYFSERELELLKYKKILLRAEAERGTLASMPYSIVLEEVAETLD